MSKSEVFEQVYDLTRQIPRGRVVTYGDIANVLGINPRYVGYTLHHNPYPGIIPCHRVVNSQGRVAKTFAFGGGSAQQKLLENEGIEFSQGKINLFKYRYHF